MRFLRLVGNIIWFLTIGLGLFLGEIFAGIMSIITIIPIFFGIPGVHFVNAKFVIAPFGKKVVTHFGSAPIRNILSLIFGGFFNAIFATLFGLIFCITIVGIPLGKVLFGVAKLEFAPFHADVVRK